MSNLEAVSRKHRMLLIGVTGGIASGKTTVANMLKAQGIPLIDFDILAREVVEPEKPAWRDIVAYFGERVLQKDGSLDRKVLSNIVFLDEQKRKKLEIFTHPRITEAFMAQLNEITRNNPDALIQAVVPLLIETNLLDRFHKILVVYVPAEVQIDRLTARDNITREEAARIIKAQLPIDKKIAYADFVIHNENSLQDTQNQVERLVKRLRTLQKKKRGGGCILRRCFPETVFERPDNWTEMTWQEKRDTRFDRWINMDGIPFDTPEAEKQYKERAVRLCKAAKMEIPDRVPCMLPAGWFPAMNAGITLKEAMYNPQKMKWAWLKFLDEYDTDTFDGTIFFYGPVHDLLDTRDMRWPSHGLADDTYAYQFVEGEYMKADEYDLFMKDPFDFQLRHLLPLVAVVHDDVGGTHLEAFPAIVALRIVDLRQVIDDGDGVEGTRLHTLVARDTPH